MISFIGVVGWVHRICRLHPCIGEEPPNECSRFVSIQSDGDLQVMLKFVLYSLIIHMHAES